MKRQPVELPVIVSVRFAESNFRQLISIATTNRRTLSQTVRLLVEAALSDDRCEHGQPNGGR